MNQSSKNVPTKSPVIQHSIENHIFNYDSTKSYSAEPNASLNYQLTKPVQTFWDTSYYSQQPTHFSLYSYPIKYNLNQDTSPNCYYQPSFEPVYYQYQQPFNYAFQNLRYDTPSFPSSENIQNQSGKRHAEKQPEFSEHNMGQPAKRANISQTSLNSLPFSPLNYTSSSTSSVTKYEPSDHGSDDSVSSADYAPSVNPSSTDSFYFSHKAYSQLTNNESGYYTHSPNSIDLTLESAYNQTNSTE